MTEPSEQIGVLAGRRVVVTRAAAQAGPLVERLEALGAVPVLVPLIRIVDPSDGGAALTAAVADLGRFDWVIVTSPNGATRLRDAVDATARRPRFAAVGGATARALGRPVDLVPAVQTAAGLAAEMPAGDGNVLLVGPEGERSDLAARLAAAGWTVTEVPAYRTEPAVPTPVERDQVLAADAVLFASGSAVRSWIAAFGTSAPPVVVVIGPSTAQVAQQNGLKVNRVAADQTLDELVGGLVASFSGHA